MTTFPNASSPVNPAAPVNATPVAAKPGYDVQAVAIETARLLSDDKCTDVTLLDVRGISSVQDFVILASGTSDRQMRSAAAGVKNLLPTLGSSVYRTSIDDQSTWIVVDCVDTVIHIFEPNTRSYYDLESMWGDAPKVEWLRPGQKPYTIGDQSEVAPAETSAGDTDEPAAAPVQEASEPDADIELTTGSAEEFVDEVRSSVARPVKKAAKPVAKKATTKTTAKKSAVKKIAKPVKKAAKPAVKKSAAKKAPAKKATAKAAAKPAKKAAAKTVKKAAKPVKKAKRK